jgi:tetratricopeptide (TPR) repeat protein
MNKSAPKRLAWLSAVIPVLMVMCGPLQSAQTSPSEVPTAEGASTAIESALSLADTVGPRLGEEADELTQMGETAVRNNPNNAPNRVVLALTYKESGMFRKAVEQLNIAVELNPKLSDAHCVMGDVMYELALMNMVLREEFVSAEKTGLLLFKPGGVSRQIFSQAVSEYNLASKIATEGLTRTKDGFTVEICDIQEDYRRSRLERASLYASGQAPENIAYTEDQAKAAIWLLKKATQQEREAQLGLANSMDEIAALFVAKVTTSNRKDKTYLVNVINMSSAFTKYITYCAGEKQPDAYLRQRSEEVAVIIRNLTDLGFDPKGPVFRPVVENTCPGREVWGDIEKEILDSFESEQQHAAVNFYRLPSLKIFLQRGIKAGQAYRDTVTEQLPTVRSTLYLSEELQSALNRLTNGIKQAQSEEDWQKMETQANTWLDSVVDYSLELP